MMVKKKEFSNDGKSYSTNDKCFLIQVFCYIYFLLFGGL